MNFHLKMISETSLPFVVSDCELRVRNECEHWFVPRASHCALYNTRGWIGAELLNGTWRWTYDNTEATYTVKDLLSQRQTFSALLKIFNITVMIVNKPL